MSASDTALRLVSAAVIASLKSGMSPETPVVSISIICSSLFLLSSDTSAVRSVYILSLAYLLIERMSGEDLQTALQHRLLFLVFVP